MEKYKGPRYQVIGPRAQVTKVEKGLSGVKIHLTVMCGPQMVPMIWDVPITATDLRAGEYVTIGFLATEIPIQRN